MFAIKMTISFILLLIAVLGVAKFLASYTKVLRSIEPVTITGILKLAMLMSVSGLFLSFSGILLGLMVIEQNYEWNFDYILSILIVSFIPAVLTFFATVHRINRSIKDRDLLNGKYRKNKVDLP